MLAGSDVAPDAEVVDIDGVEAPISLKTVDQALCSGGFVPVLFGANHEVLRVGDKKRTFPSAMRKAITARDGGCIIPGCDVPAYRAEFHHMIPWALGGKTEVANETLLCWRHHHNIETSGWQIRMTRESREMRGPRWMDPIQA